MIDNWSNAGWQTIHMGSKIRRQPVKCLSVTVEMGRLFGSAYFNPWQYNGSWIRIIVISGHAIPVTEKPTLTTSQSLPANPPSSRTTTSGIQKGLGATTNTVVQSKATSDKTTPTLTTSQSLPVNPPSSSTTASGIQKGPGTTTNAVRKVRSTTASSVLQSKQNIQQNIRPTEDRRCCRRSIDGL